MVQPIAKRTNSDAITEELLPTPFIPSSVLIIANPGFAHFNIYCDGELVV